MPFPWRSLLRLWLSGAGSFPAGQPRGMEVKRMPGPWHGICRGDEFLCLEWDLLAIVGGKRLHPLCFTPISDACARHQRDGPHGAGNGARSQRLRHHDGGVRTWLGRLLSNARERLGAFYPTDGSHRRPVARHSGTQALGSTVKRHGAEPVPRFWPFTALVISTLIIFGAFGTGYLFDDNGCMCPQKYGIQRESAERYFLRPSACWSHCAAFAGG